MTRLLRKLLSISNRIITDESNGKRAMIVPNILNVMCTTQLSALSNIHVTGDTRKNVWAHGNMFSWSCLYRRAQHPIVPFAIPHPSYSLSPVKCLEQIDLIHSKSDRKLCWDSIFA
ncbi:unnamed protein product [Albugo candida]|uniref:Uncharacterized protein n=1 Tax=Albugo candida TaxID=65357 RepID=A0A024G8C6_9STRA|nr:unnamed protein product [Albugo candida]|eukprot:CCI43131.1 unnamed protein product [Albugo candida]